MYLRVIISVYLVGLFYKPVRDMNFLILLLIFDLFTFRIVTSCIFFVQQAMFIQIPFTFHILIHLFLIIFSYLLNMTPNNLIIAYFYAMFIN